MFELQYALEVGVQVEVKELNNGEIQVAWANGKCVEIISKEEAIELGLVKEEVQEAATEDRLKSFEGELVSYEGKLNQVLETIAVEYGVEWKSRNKKVEMYLLNTPAYITKHSSKYGNDYYKVHFDGNVNFFIQMKENKKTGNYLLISQ